MPGHHGVFWLPALIISLFPHKAVILKGVFPVTAARLRRIFTVLPFHDDAFILKNTPVFHINKSVSE
jgi:hypothetical protein